MVDLLNFSTGAKKCLKCNSVRSIIDVGSDGYLDNSEVVCIFEALPGDYPVKYTQYLKLSNGSR